MITLTLVFKDGTRWVAGGFNSMAEIEAWLADQQKRPDWDSQTKWEVVENSDPKSNVDEGV